MNREELNEQIKEEGKAMPEQHVGAKKSRRAILAAAVALVIIGGAGGYYFHDLPFLNRPSQTASYKIPDSSTQQKPPENLPAVRNTAVVQAVKKVGPAVVGITTRVYDRDIFNRRVQVGQSVGSGVLFDKEGYIVTNNHVVSGSKDVNVSLSNGKTVQGKVVGTDPSTDLAVVKIDAPSDIPVAELGDSDQIQVGETVIAIGNPLGLEFQGTVTVGVVSALNRTLDEMEQRFKLIQTDAAINPGNSGGALVTADGKVIGINSAKIAKEGVEGMGFAIPINQAKGIIEELIQKGHVTRAYLGLYGADKDIAARYGYAWDNAKGVLVMKVAEDSPLSLSQIRMGDYITAIDGKEINTVLELRSSIDSHKPGDTITLTYTRDGATRTAEVMLGEMKSSDQ